MSRLCIHGDDEAQGPHRARLPAVPLPGLPCAQAEAIHSWLPGSHLELVDQAGHVPMFERRETMNRLIHDFLVAAA